MRFTRETVHEPENGRDNRHMSSKVIEAIPFYDARIKQGGYGFLSDDFWLWRTPQRGFSAFVFTLSGSGVIILDDGTEVNVKQGDVFISSPQGQGHYEYTPKGETWEMLWVTVWGDSPMFIPPFSDYEIRKFDNIEELRVNIQGIFREELYQDHRSEAAMEKYEQLFLISMDRALGFNESKALNRHRQELSQLWVRVSRTLSDVWTLDRLCSETGYSKSHLSRICLELYNKTPGAMITEMKMQQAKVMLINSVQSVDRIASLLGYSRLSAFSYAFKEYFGMSPREYRDTYTKLKV